MTTKSVLALAFEAGLRPFDMMPTDASSRNTGTLAAAMLRDRNLYFLPEYIERFNTQVHSIEISPQRLAMGVVESALPPSGVRRYRAVIFRCDGEVMYQTSDNRVLEQNAAHIDMRYFLTHIDEQRVLELLCLQQMRISVRMRDAAERVVGILHKQGP